MDERRQKALVEDVTNATVSAAAIVAIVASIGGYHRAVCEPTENRLSAIIANLTKGQ